MSTHANPLRPLLLYVAAAILAGSLLAYPAHAALTPFVDWPLHRVMRRTMMLTILAGIPFFLAATGARGRTLLGFGCAPGRFFMMVGASFAVGLLTVLPPLAVLLALGLRIPSVSPAEMLHDLPATAATAVLAALTVGLIEEAYFRGALMGAWLRQQRIGQALIATSLFFAIAHFLVAERVPAEVRWYSGLELVAAGVAGLFAQAHSIGAFLALLAAGLLLGALRIRFGNIGPCIGFHAGWVAAITAMHRLTDLRPDHELAWLVGDTDGVMGWLALGWIVLLSAAYFAFGGGRGLIVEAPPPLASGSRSASGGTRRSGR
ncbi:MAG TPA: CPBP family intramembrane glutamic endopeptidase [Gammaproteobacteria bacterium]